MLKIVFLEMDRTGHYLTTISDSEKFDAHLRDSDNEYNTERKKFSTLEEYSNAKAELRRFNPSQNIIHAVEIVGKVKKLCKRLRELAFLSGMEFRAAQTTLNKMNPRPRVVLGDQAIEKIKKTCCF